MLGRAGAVLGIIELNDGGPLVEVPFPNNEDEGALSDEVPLVMATSFELLEAGAPNGDAFAFFPVLSSSSWSSSSSSISSLVVSGAFQMFDLTGSGEGDFWLRVAGRERLLPYRNRSSPFSVTISQHADDLTLGRVASTKDWDGSTFICSSVNEACDPVPDSAPFVVASDLVAGARDRRADLRTGAGGMIFASGLAV